MALDKDDWIRRAMVDPNLWTLVMAEDSNSGLAFLYGSTWAFSPNPRCPLYSNGIYIVTGRGLRTGWWSLDPGGFNSPTPENINLSSILQHGSSAYARNTLGISVWSSGNHPMWRSAKWKDVCDRATMQYKLDIITK